MTLTVPAPAKLNLFLHITGRRPDGYHLLESIFQFLDISDELGFTPISTPEILLSPAIPGVAHEDNLIVRAAEALKQHCGRPELGVQIELVKVLPMGGGLGGGSSDAATTLIALNHLWQLGLSRNELMAIGLNLGADVPIFVFGHAAFATGVGEQLTKVEPEESWYLVVHPGIEIITQAVFTHPDLPRATPALPQALSNWQEHQNDCQALVFKLYPQVAQAHQWLLEYAPSRMTGTGACLFAPFSSRGAAAQALADLPKNYRGFIAKGLNRSPAYQALAMCSEG